MFNFPMINVAVNFKSHKTEPWHRESKKVDDWLLLILAPAHNSVGSSHITE